MEEDEGLPKRPMDGSVLSGSSVSSMGDGWVTYKEEEEERIGELNEAMNVDERGERERPKAMEEDEGSASLFSLPCSSVCIWWNGVEEEERGDGDWPRLGLYLGFAWADSSSSFSINCLL